MQKLMMSELYQMVDNDTMAIILESIDREKHSIISELMADEKFYDKEILYQHFMRIEDKHLFLRIDASYCMDTHVGPTHQITQVYRYRTRTDYIFYSEIYSWQESKAPLIKYN